MPRQHEPPTGGTPPSVAVRRAVSVPAPGRDPGAELRPRSPEPARAAEPARASEPVVAPEAPEAIPAPSDTGAAAEKEREQEQESRPAAEPAAEGEATAAVGLAATGDAAGDTKANAAPAADETAPGRLRGPMVAAAALVGAVLICVPLLVLALSGEEERTVETAPVGGTTLDPGASDDLPAAAYQAAPPSPSESPSAAKPSSASPAAPKAEPAPAGPVTAEAEGTSEPRPQTEKTAEDKAEDKAEPKTKKSPEITARQLANALSTRVNAQLRNVATGKCADLPYYDKGSVDGPVSQYNCRPTGDNQLWDLVVADADGGPRGASLFVVKNRKDGLCMDLPNYGSVAPGTKVTEYHCRPAADNQLWWLEPASGGYRIRNAASDLCMSVAGGGSAGNDARLQVVRCGSGSSALRWSVVSVV